MVRIYTCGACQMGNHENCERGHSVPKGTFGGSACICRCRGRSLRQWQKDEENDFSKKLREMCRKIVETTQRRK